MTTHSQYPCLGNPVDRGAWRAAVHGVTKSRTEVTYTHKSLWGMHSLKTPPEKISQGQMRALASGPAPKWTHEMTRSSPRPTLSSLRVGSRGGGG